jgi:hypothetical protein
MLCPHNARLFAAVGTSLYYSAENDETTWKTGSVDNEMPVGEDDGEQITGLVSKAGSLQVLKENSIWHLYGWSDKEWVLRKELDGIGCVAPHSVASGLGRTFFVSRDGVYVDSGNSLARVSDPIQPLLDKLSRSDLEKAVGSFHQGNYYLSIPIAVGGANTLLLVYRLENSDRGKGPVWEVYDTIGGNAIVSLTGPDDSGWLLVGSSAASALVHHVLTTAADVAANITAYAETGRLIGSQYDAWVMFGELWVDADFPANASMTVTWTAYKNAGSTATGTITLTAAGRKHLPPTCQGRDIKLRLTFADQKSGWRLRGFSLTVVPKRVNR